MLGIFLTILGTIFEEASTSIGKTEIARHVESISGLGFINACCAMVFFLGLIIVNGPALSLAVVPPFLVRVVCELLLAIITVHAVAKCSRSTFGFIRVSTIPTLLLVDVAMGYTLRGIQIGGIALITAALLYLYKNHGFEKRGAWLAVAAALFAVVTASLAKYDFSHGNTLELEQVLVHAVLTLYFGLVTLWHGQNPFVLFRKPPILLQAATVATSAIILTYGFNLVTPSIHMAAKRSTAALASVGSGYLAFHEKRMHVKLIAGVLAVMGIVLLFL